LDSEKVLDESIAVGDSVSCKNIIPNVDAESGRSEEVITKLVQ
jgi:hypothetical protein